MGDGDRHAAERLERARSRLLADVTTELSDRPWLSGSMPATDSDLVRFAGWRARLADVDREIVLAGVSLLEAARAELEQLEAALLFAARGAGVTWADIAEALGLGSAQAAQQRFDRVWARTTDGEDG